MKKVILKLFINLKKESSLARKTVYVRIRRNAHTIYNVSKEKNSGGDERIFIRLRNDLKEHPSSIDEVYKENFSQRENKIDAALKA